jgi:hypothetical protein
MEEYRVLGGWRTIAVQAEELHRGKLDAAVAQSKSQSDADGAVCGTFHGGVTLVAASSQFGT